jgi:hypothetical protein
MLPQMADYYATIAKAVGALDRNTRDARGRLYQRARVALVAHMRGAAPALNQSDILAAQIALEEAIGRVEAEAQRDRRSHQPGAAPPTFGDNVVAAEQRRDNWLSELLARASREEHE